MQPALVPPFVQRAGTIHVKLKLTPKASRNAIDGLSADCGHDMCVGARVTAVPEKGHANEALLKLLAAEWRVPRRRLSVVHGLASRRKTIAIDGADDELVQSLNAWARAQKGEQRR
ncbi:MAG: DUF167 family protein [Proteobacteria bacterium]|nr:DUF167 family protein [Pseudomonadota bacterium]